MANPSPRDGMDDWWAEIGEEVLACVRRDGETSPAAVGQQLGVSEATTASFLSMLAAEGRIRICLVGLPDDRGDSIRRLRASTES